MKYRNTAFGCRSHYNSSKKMASGSLCRFLFVLAGVCFSVCPLYGQAYIASIDSLPFFYQRTIYLENLNQPAAWWANPAVISAIDKTTFFTSNTGMLGGKYALSSVRVLFPYKTALNGGVGITGTGTTEGRSAVANAQSTQFNSDFSFKRPSIETVISFMPPRAGTIGGLAMAGTESIPRTTDTGNKTYFFWGIGTGWLSPSILNTVKLSFSTLSVCHIQFETWWDNSAKAGILFNINKDHLIGSIEYGFGLNGTSAPEYEVFKGDFSLRFMSITGLLFGFSTDTRNIRNNGSTFHTGIELRRSYVYPFFGGYEIGFNMFASRYNPNSLPDPSPHLSLIHRFWLGYDLRNNRP